MKILLVMKKAVCHILGHAGPGGMPYREGAPARFASGNASLSRVEWDCPRCGQPAWALTIRPDSVPRTRGANRIEHETD